MSENVSKSAKISKIRLDNLVDLKKMLKNAYFLAKIGADTAENEQHFAEILPIGRRVAPRRPPREALGNPLRQDDEPGEELRQSLRGSAEVAYLGLENKESNPNTNTEY